MADAATCLSQRIISVNAGFMSSVDVMHTLCTDSYRVIGGYLSNCYRAVLVKCAKF